MVDDLRAKGFQFVAIGGHSHGGWRAQKIAERYGPEALDFLGLLDDCPLLNPGAQFGPPIEFPAAAAFGFACWQHNSEPAGIKFIPRPQVLVADATAWRDPKVGHIDFPDFGMASIAGDARVWAAIEEQLAAAIDSRQF